jgi:hypothetical protein
MPALFFNCAVGWVEPKAKPTVSMSVIHSRKVIGITQLGR